MEVTKSANVDAIVTGESLGTSGLSDTEKHAGYQPSDFQLTWPLIAVDKNDIIAQAEAIGTYEISNEQPFEDCCTVFTLNHHVPSPN